MNLNLIAHGTGRTLPCQRGHTKLAGAIFIALALAWPAWGKTITLTDVDMDRMAAIDAAAPRLSWAAYESVPGVFLVNHIVARPRASFLMCYPLDKIPAGQRITKAELLLPVYTWTSQEPRLYVWRVLGDWGTGVCHQYRMIRPQKVEWSVAGATGPSIDRATKPTTVGKVDKPNSDIVLNVTEDVELWYTGAAANQGWQLTVEDSDATILFHSPLWAARGQWRLRLTYEPQ